MSNDVQSTLWIARRLARFEEHLAQTSWRGLEFDEYGRFGGDAAALAVWCQKVLDCLGEGFSSDEAILNALDAWQAIRDEVAERDRERDTARARKEAQRETDEAITRKVECPYCGAQPGDVCRTVGLARNSKLDSHRDRYRLARSLNDGVEESEQ